LRVQAGRPRFNSLKGQWRDLFLFVAASRPASYQWVPRVLYPGLKRSGSESDHSSPCSAEIKNAWSYNSTPPFVFMARYFVMLKDTFSFTFK
jgi:hypothetical protein